MLIPIWEKKLLDQLDKTRIERIKQYNSVLKQEVLSRGSYYLDVYALTSTENRENNNLHMCNPTHLSPKCLSIFLKVIDIKQQILLNRSQVRRYNYSIN